MVGSAARGLCLVSVLGVLACNTDVGSAECGGQPCHAARTVTASFQTTNSHDLDVLFVIDDGTASASAPPVGAGAYARLAAVLRSLPPSGQAAVSEGEGPSLHVGFVPSSYAGGDSCRASATRARACGLPASDEFLATAACGQQPNFAGPLEIACDCMANVGASACDPPRLLASVRRALGGDPGVPPLAGASAFLRAGTLQIVIVAAQDDASGSAADLDDVASFAAFVRSLKADPSQVFVSVIGPSSACATGASPVPSAPRLEALVAAFGSHGAYVASCSDRPEEALVELSARLARLDVECLDGVRDNDAAAPGVQASCAVEDRTERLDGGLAAAALPNCDEAKPPCWRLQSDPACLGSALRLQVDREMGFCPWLSTQTTISCVTGP